MGKLISIERRRGFIVEDLLIYFFDSIAPKQTECKFVFRPSDPTSASKLDVEFRFIKGHKNTKEGSNKPPWLNLTKDQVTSLYFVKVFCLRSHCRFYATFAFIPIAGSMPTNIPSGKAPTSNSSSAGLSSSSLSSSAKSGSKAKSKKHQRLILDQDHDFWRQIVLLFKPILNQTGQIRRVLFILILNIPFSVVPNSNVKFFRGSPIQTQFSSSKKNSVSDFDSPCSVSNEEAEHMPKSAEKDDQSIKDPLESDLNTLLQTEEDLITEKHASLFPSCTMKF
ncbi:putative RNA polymerase II transcription factor B subunit 1-1 isoform X1 [Cucumis melo var. makuwa]|uniref:Putative RNA polymerase II transcription factor B subunit 1-1 isoform X1 n=1 Tax=Cucumis melo var. makuwa TaxID=1194695 RepID=A0A5D3BDL5_CUCMM|nr:putative RNA polymerase II transcription factor B subunit 1-1 isoform X1 [Cucumis melo var. makuwa]